MEVEKKIKKILNEVMDSSVEIGNCNDDRFRCSYLSEFCQVKFIMIWILNSAEDSFMKDFFCNIGSVIHSTIQKWLGINTYLYGNWECSNCKKIYKNRFGPIKCCENNLCIYKEYELIWGKLKGHCDGLILIDNEFWILEFKTITVKGFKDIDDTGKPLDFHINQANMYTIMGQKLNLSSPLVGSIIIYIQRDNPRKYKAFVHRGMDFKKFKNTINNFYRAREMVKNGKFINVIKNCSDKYLYCPYRSLCKRGDINKVLKEFWNKKYEQ